MIKKWVINDYCTPGIKAEVIIDMLISEFIEEILYCGLELWQNGTEIKDIQLLLKEFPIQIDENENTDRNFKVDYLVADHKGKIVYVIELKSADMSYSKEQRIRYSELEDDGHKFGKYLDFVEELIKKYGKEYASSRSATKIFGSRKYYFTRKKVDKIFKDAAIREYQMKVQYLSLDYMPQEEKAIVIKQLVPSTEFKEILETRGKIKLWEDVVDILGQLWKENDWKEYFEEEKLI